MKKIGVIFINDLKNMFKNIPTIIIMLGLIILPSLYAWFNIKANWDPYSATQGIQVAIVNEDQGATILDQTVNIGAEVVDELKKNNKLGWTFVNLNDAEYGVKSGKYYAYIIIPKEFSTDLKSITEDVQITPNLIYVINEKSNAIAPKITSSGANSLKITISQNIITTVNRVIFNVFNDVGFSIENNLPQIKQASNYIISLDENSAQIKTNLEDYRQGILNAENLMTNVKKDLPLVQETVKQVNDVATNSKDILISSQDLLTRLGDDIEMSLMGISQVSEDTVNWSNEFIPKLQKAKGGEKILTSLLKRLDTLSIWSERSQNMIAKLNSLLGNNLDGINTHLTHLTNKIQLLQTEVNDALWSVKSGKKLGIETIQTLQQTINEIHLLSEAVLSEFKTTIRPELNKIVTNSITIAENIAVLSQDIEDSFPMVNDVVDVSCQALSKGEEISTIINDNLPTLEQDIHRLAEKLKFFIDDDSLDTILPLLEKNPELIAQYIASPVNLKEEALYPIPNYGSGMAPFYTVLAIWVGVVIASAILSTETTLKDMTTTQTYVGKELTFLLISLVQSFIIVLGDCYILKIYLVDTMAFILICLFIAFVFTSVIYTLVSLFGNVGKGIVIILLVLQISSSGGTFPIEVIPVFFQKISPFLPFTYAIGALREAQGGIFYPSLYRDLIGLSIFAAIFILVGLVLKKPLEKLSHTFNENFKLSGLGE